MNQMFDYSRPLSRNEAQVHLLDYDEAPGFTGLADRVVDAGRTYGFSVSVLTRLTPWQCAPPPTGHRLLLVVTRRPFDEPLADLLLTEGLARYSVISVAFRYDDEAQMLSYADAVEKFKRLAADRINFLRPVADPDGAMSVPDDKLLDNSVCDSVRIKYRPVNTDPLPVVLDEQTKEFFQHASRAFQRYRLYHRSASDGYFACRPQGATGYFITATKSYKDPLDLRRIAFVEGYDEATNELRYRGAYLPSSDSVEASILMALRPEVSSIVHTHASEIFTRNPRFRDRVLVGIERYGEPQLGHLVHRALNLVDDGFLIMEDHGEVFVNDTPEVSPILLSLVRR
ncbi:MULTISPECIES: aldolase [unclassified Nocardiopsis]|uniref:aldolase n=2 Tax=Nocardiopsis TaxID=2013 RepID=UPI00135996EC|nr:MULTISPECIES: aldolase [unclassified Nocardiopsis]